MKPWSSRVICPGFMPRQFEYSPHDKNVMVFGTLQGEAVVVDYEQDRVLKRFNVGRTTGTDSILGLCWLNEDRTKFVAGSSKGVLAVCELDKTDQLPSKGSIQEASPVRERFAIFPELTSVHVNCSDSMLITSGYSHNVRVTDLAKGRVVRTYNDIHSDHINISRFSNHSPHLFATSSFDKTVKLWDTRMQSNWPIYSLSAAAGHVMLCFSRDDLWLLTSGTDNEIRQYSMLDGQLMMQLDIPKLHRKDNYTRAYYLNESSMILSGSSEESVVRIHCANTGSLLHEAEMYPGRKDCSVYIQSLRGDPHEHNKFSVLINYRDSVHPLEIIGVTMRSANDIGIGSDEGNSYIVRPGPMSNRLAFDMKRALEDTENADIKLRLCDGSTLPCHSSVLRCRSVYLRDLLEKQGPLSGSGHDQEQEIVLAENVSRSSMMTVLAFVYTDELFIYDGHRGDRLHQREVVENDGSNSGSTWRLQNAEGLKTGPIFESRERPVPWITLKAVAELFRVSTFMGLARLKALLEWHCVNFIWLDSVERIAKIALEAGADQLLEYCVYYICKNYSLVLLRQASNEWSEPVRHRVMNRVNQSKFKICDRDVPAIMAEKDNHRENRQWTGKFPAGTGHTINVIFGDYLLAMGGCNRQHFLSFRQLLLFSLRSQSWSRVDCKGHLPLGLIYHTATAIEDGNEARHLVVIGGNQRSRLNQVGNWMNRAITVGCEQLQFSKIFVLDCLEMQWTVPEVNGRGPDQRTGHTTVALYPSLLREGPGIAGGYDSTRNTGRQMATSVACIMIVFGGYSALSKQCMNDVSMLVVQSNRRSGPGKDRYSYVWRSPLVSGQPPLPRLAHSSTMVPFSASEGGPRMIIFGGVGHGIMLNDVVSLALKAAPREVSWEFPEVAGVPPSPRYGHTATLVPGRSQIVFTGGCSPMEDGSGSRIFNDVYVAFVNIRFPSHLVIAWSELRPGGIPPVPRSRHAAAAVDSQLWIFGGSDDNTPADDEDDLLAEGRLQPPIDSDIHALNMSTNNWEAVDAVLCEPGPESAVIVPERRLHLDLANLINGGKYSDIEIYPGLVAEKQSALASSSNMEVDFITDVGSSKIHSEGVCSNQTVTERKIKCHRVIVAARNQQLAALVSRSGMRESAEGIVRFPFASPEATLGLVQFLYTDNLIMPVDHLMELIWIAHEYMMDDLLSLCQGALIPLISGENIWDMIVVADMYNLSKLYKAAVSFVIRHYSSLRLKLDRGRIPHYIVADIDKVRQTRHHAYCVDHLSLAMQATHAEKEMGS